MTHSNAKKRPQVTTIRPRVRGRTPLCRDTIIRPSQKKRFLPGNTSHFLRSRLLLLPLQVSADEGDSVSVRGSICWYSQFFIVVKQRRQVSRCSGRHDTDVEFAFSLRVQERQHSGVCLVWVQFSCPFSKLMLASSLAS